jgi:hypothetical protein
MTSPALTPPFSKGGLGGFGIVWVIWNWRLEFIKLPENPRLSSLGMNGARSDAR